MKKASALMEFAIVLGIVSAVLVTMNIYMKRGLQGKVKDMTDYFISGGQSAQEDRVDSEVETISQSNVHSGSTLTDKSYLGGGKKMTLSENTSISADSTTKDMGNSPTKANSSTFVPAEAGQFDNLNRPKDADFVDPKILAECGDACNVGPNTESEWRTNIDKAYLARERDRLTARAVSLDKAAQTLNLKAQEVSRAASRIGCPRKRGGACRSAQADLRAKAAQMAQSATGLQNQANAARTEAALIDQKISSL